MDRFPKKTAIGVKSRESKKVNLGKDSELMKISLKRRSSLASNFDITNEDQVFKVKILIN